MYKNKIFLITGGTGSFGQALVSRLIQSNFREIRVLSRDEKKQNDMRNRFADSRIKYLIGDVRDEKSISYFFKDVDYVFHAAALKQVPSCEFFPVEALKTNALGTNNVLDAAICAGVEKVVCLSTDKAVYPINAMGITKALMEKIAISKSRISCDTNICITRYGNVMASRGSVIPHFIKQIRSSQPITITDPYMTRFLMSLDDAVDLVLYAFNNGRAGELFVQKSPAATVQDLAKSLCNIMSTPNHPIKIIGTRHGEKLYETLLSREEFISTNDCGNYYVVQPDSRDLNYGSYFDCGNKEVDSAYEYTSHNTNRLDESSLTKLLLQLPYIKSLLHGHSQVL